MKWAFSILTIMSLLIPVGGDTLYFWLENSELTEQNLLETDDTTFKAYANYNSTKTELNLSIGKGNGWWKYNSDTKKYEFVTEELVPGDFGHKSENYGPNGEYRTVYAMDTGTFKIDRLDDVTYSLALELDLADGTHYIADILESEIWDYTYDSSRYDPKYDHKCTGIEMTKSSSMVPEPNSLMLLLIGGSLLLLGRRRRNYSMT